MSKTQKLLIANKKIRSKNAINTIVTTPSIPKEIEEGIVVTVMHSLFSLLHSLIPQTHDVFSFLFFLEASGLS